MAPQLIFPEEELAVTTPRQEDDEEIEDGSELKLGDAPMAPPLNINNHQESKLGIGRAHV